MKPANCLSVDYFKKASRSCLIVAAIFQLASCRNVGGSGAELATSGDANFVFPGEFDHHDTIWMAWAVADNKRGFSVHDVQTNMINALRGHVDVDLIVQNNDEIADIKSQFAAKKMPTDHLHMHIVPHTDIWIRDFGPIFTRSVDGKSLRVSDFNFNTWGYETTDSANSSTNGAVDGKVGNELGIDVVKTDVISEGGDRELNGQGTLIVTESVEFNRNPGLSPAYLENAFKKTLGVSNIIWLKQGVVEDDMSYDGPLPGGYYTVITTGGHVDEFVRFVSPKRILLAEVTQDEINAETNADFRQILTENRRRMEVNYAILRNARDVDGKPFEIIRIPMPPLVPSSMSAGDGVFDYLQQLKFTKGPGIKPGNAIKVLIATSYLNFLVTNGIVLGQSYYRTGMSDAVRAREELAKRTLQKVFPDREIKLLDTTAVNMGGGGVHCITQQQPSTK